MVFRFQVKIMLFLQEKNMKILPVNLIREADAYTIQNEPITSIDLMERAATQCFKWIKKRITGRTLVHIFAGPGNNGGDGLVIARLLHSKGYQVRVYIVKFTENYSHDFQNNLERLRYLDDIAVVEINENDPFPEIGQDDLVIDAIFGSGLSRSVSGFVAELITKLNQSGAIIIAIDMPSGLFADECSVDKKGAIVEADYTLSFQFPKLAFLFPENDKFVGEWHILPIGLMNEFVDKAEVKNFLIHRVDAGMILKPRSKYAHKGNFGHALLISGSYGKMGAAVLASVAALRSGAGLVTAHIPKKGYEIIQTAAPEVMVSIDENDLLFSMHPEMGLFNAVAVGPGIGTEKTTQNALKLLIQNVSFPLLLDADAINILAENKTWIPFLPQNSILTPHPKEFERLVGKSPNNFERNRIQVEFSIKHQVYIVLKGAHSCITTPNGNCWFNSTGNPGMATAGSGDVLTGIILGLLAQHYSPADACILGVYLHGLAGDLAARRMSQEAMIAGDIINNLGKAFRITAEM